MCNSVRSKYTVMLLNESNTLVIAVVKATTKLHIFIKKANLQLNIKENALIEKLPKIAKYIERLG